MAASALCAALQERPLRVSRLYMVDRSCSTCHLWGVYLCCRRLEKSATEKVPRLEPSAEPHTERDVTLFLHACKLQRGCNASLIMIPAVCRLRL
jgi:hypothetical protein